MTRSINSPGVEITETDLSLNTELPYGTTVYVVGFAAQGPTNEMLNITSQDEWDVIYGTPTNAAERYFYHTCKQVLLQNGNLLTTRVPYGSGAGEGSANKYSALVFPVYPHDNTYLNYTNLSANLVPIDFEGTVVEESSFVSTPAKSTYTGYVGLWESVDSSYYSSFCGFTSACMNYFYVENWGNSVQTIYFVRQNDGSYVAHEGSTSGAVTTSWCGSAYMYSDNSQDTTYKINLSTCEISSLTSGQIGAHVIYNTVATSATNIGMPLLSKATDYILGQPVHVLLSDSEFSDWKQGGISWQNNVIDHSGALVPNLSSYSIAPSGVGCMGMAGLVVVNELKTSIESDYSGYYIAMADNSKIGGVNNGDFTFDSLTGVKTIGNTTAYDQWLTLENTRLSFTLSGTNLGNQGSISEIVENVPTWDFSNKGNYGYSDSIILTLFKLRQNIYSTDSVLDKVLYEVYSGSFDSTRTIVNSNKTSKESYFIENVINNVSNSVYVMVNPYISKYSGLWFDGATGNPTKTIRFANGAKSDGVSQPAPKAGALFNYFGANQFIKNADNMYGVGQYAECNDVTKKWIGDLPSKIETALNLVNNRELTRVDIVPEGGLGTVWVGTRLNMENWPSGTVSTYGTEMSQQIFDDTVYIHGIIDKHTFDADSDGLADSVRGSSAEANDLYETIFNIFETYCSTTRADCLYIADPLRYIFVQGNGEIKVLDDTTKTFAQDIYVPLKNLYGAANSSYACTFANWFKVWDSASSQYVWLPPSGFISRLAVLTDTSFYPWFAIAGLSKRGVIKGIVDIGMNPIQKQRDLLYKIGINSTVYWPNDGYVIWGNKTLQAKSSAFSSINIRRLFLWLEKATLAVTRYYVFEQNTVYTRNRLKNSLAPIFDYAKNYEGVYDYLLVCDDRNNTATTIDNNELIVDIYVKPVHVAEYILVNFYATKTGQDFSELV